MRTVRMGVTKIIVVFCKFANSPNKAIQTSQTTDCGSVTNTCRLNLLWNNNVYCRNHKERVHTYIHTYVCVQTSRARRKDRLRIPWLFHKELRENVPQLDSQVSFPRRLFQRHESHIIITAVGSSDKKAITYADRKAGVALPSSYSGNVSKPPMWLYFRLTRLEWNFH